MSREDPILETSIGIRQWLSRGAPRELTVDVEELIAAAHRLGFDVFLDGTHAHVFNADRTQNVWWELVDGNGVIIRGTNDVEFRGVGEARAYIQPFPYPRFFSNDMPADERAALEKLYSDPPMAEALMNELNDDIIPYWPEPLVYLAPAIWTDADPLYVDVRGGRRPGTVAFEGEAIQLLMRQAADHLNQARQLIAAKNAREGIRSSAITSS